jgi:hypothetical protein
MRLEKEIREKIMELESDERHHYPPAQVMINAPLALIQVEIDAKISALKWTLKNGE